MVPSRRWRRSRRALPAPPSVRSHSPSGGVAARCCGAVGYEAGSWLGFGAAFAGAVGDGFVHGVELPG
ncbi:hypothetical protein XA68_14640 [Ophiocordyceps unilateralis]|uniref:Uncharacterized protein n=1 Tax=Ophiocordyceps unilateralis TaxID=268505 RepID=A0A2A9P9P4_OPHUN|nr:hypothetical protein XA68_14640 [Ophiocordyceps unilateralis]